jgi:hypothetical protein
MHEAFKAVFDEHENPTHACKQDIHDGLGSVCDIVSAAHMQVAKYRSLIGKAKRAGLDAGYEWKIAHIEQTFRGLADAVQALDQAAERVTDLVSNLDRYMLGARADIERLTALERGGPLVPPRDHGTIERISPPPASDPVG